MKIIGLSIEAADGNARKQIYVNVEKIVFFESVGENLRFQPKYKTYLYLDNGSTKYVFETVDEIKEMINGKDEKGSGWSRNGFDGGVNAIPLPASTELKQVGNIAQHGAISGPDGHSGD